MALWNVFLACLYVRIIYPSVLIIRGFFVKTFRVWWIISRSNQTMSITIVPFWQICAPVILAVLGEAGFNIAWDVALTPYLDREDYPETNEFILYCAGDRGMWIGWYSISLFAND